MRHPHPTDALLRFKDAEKYAMLLQASGTEEPIKTRTNYKHARTVIAMIIWKPIDFVQGCWHVGIRKNWIILVATLE